MGESFEVSAAVTNTGKRRGTEIVQLYVRDQVGDVTRPVRELKGFERVALEPGETRRVKFTLSTDDLAFTNQKLRASHRTGQVRRVDRRKPTPICMAALRFGERPRQGAVAAEDHVLGN